jgi:hypothetical protein
LPSGTCITLGICKCSLSAKTIHLTAMFF